MKNQEQTKVRTARTLSMKGGGYYSQRTRGAKDVIDNAAGMLLEAADAIAPPNEGHPIVLADFGAADGGTSESALRKCIEKIRARFPDVQIQVIYTDLPSNDFSALFKNLLGFGSLTPNTYLTDLEGVYVSASGIGFHKQLLPDASLDIGFSATAMHYGTPPAPSRGQAWTPSAPPQHPANHSQPPQSAH